MSATRARRSLIALLVGSAATASLGCPRARVLPPIRKRSDLGAMLRQLELGGIKQHSS